MAIIVVTMATAQSIFVDDDEEEAEEEGENQGGILSRIIADPF